MVQPSTTAILKVKCVSNQLESWIKWGPGSPPEIQIRGDWGKTRVGLLHTVRRCVEAKGAGGDTWLKAECLM